MTTPQFENLVYRNFLNQLMEIAAYEPIKAGTEYPFKCYAGSEPNGYTWERRIATAVDVSKVEAAWKANHIQRYDHGARR